MALSWNEIKNRALKFSKEWENETSEQAEAQTFWNEFFEVFGRKRRRVASFESKVTTNLRKNGRIDLLWKGNILIEHKSFGADLDKAHQQAIDYFPGLKDTELPKLIVVCDFQNFRVYDLDESKEYEFKLNDLHNHLKLFGFIAGYQKKSYKEQDPVNVKAAEKMGEMHDMLESSGYEGHELEVFLVRLLFCMFADDTGIFEKDFFKDCIEIKTNEDGSDLGSWLTQFFQVLNTPSKNRSKNLDEDLDQFPYINGGLFEETLPIPALNSELRNIIVDLSSLNWGKISPAIFGSMFQSAMDPEERRELGAHYTSEKNILKLIKPLFLDELWKEFKKAKKTKPQLQKFHSQLSSLKFLDPACGCGNFLVITYRELRLLELEVIKSLLFEHSKFRKEVALEADINISQLARVNVDQFFGIEYDEFPARISEVAIWLMDHQMNLRVSEEFGNYYARLPLTKTAKITHGNALRLEWEEIIDKSKISFILGNPPFYGKHRQNTEQKQDMKLVFGKECNHGCLDYVTAWYLKAARYIQETDVKCAFVSTNSISQGEQVGVLWKLLFEKYHLKIHFAHRTFKWNNEAKGKAAVHVVIIGFAAFNTKKSKLIYEYEDIALDPIERKVRNINPYLGEGEDQYIVRRKTKLCPSPDIMWGSKPVDGGNLILSPDARKELLKDSPFLKKYIKQYLGADELLYNKKRYAIWLKDANPSDIKKSKKLLERINEVKKMRLESPKPATNKMADFPTLFAEIREPKGKIVVIPEVSSENREYIPLAAISGNTIVSNRNYMIINSSDYDFGVLNSKMHNIWTQYVAGRLESRITYSSGIVYNNFPWPKKISTKNRQKVETKVKQLLQTRAEYPKLDLATLYDSLTMPPKLKKAHIELDKAVDLCYRSQAFTNETARIEYLFDLYNEYTMPLLKYT